MATRISIANNHQLIFWSIAFIFSCSLAIRCASLDYQKNQPQLNDNSFKFDNQGQKENDYDKGTNYFDNNNVPTQLKVSTNNNNNVGANYIDKIDQDQKLKPSTTTWHYKKSQQQDTDANLYGSSFDRRSDTNGVTSPSEIGLARSLWNRFVGHYADPVSPQNELDYNRQKQELGDSIDSSAQISDEYDQNDLWKPIEKVENVYGGVREYPQVPREPQNMLLKSSFQLNSDAHDKYTQQKLDANSDLSNRMSNDNHDTVNNGDEAMMSHLEGYSRKYRLPSDYDFGPGDGVQSVNRRPTALTSTNDLYFIVMVAAFCGMAITIVIAAGLFAFRVQQGRKVSSESDYPTYGVVGPSIQNKGASPYSGGGGGVSSVGSASKSSGSLKSLADVLSPVENSKNVGGNATGNAHANSGDNTNPNNQRQYQTNQNAARMYHYQHQKQQMLSTDRVSSTRHTSASDLDSDEENDEGTYTVYECPGLASTHEMEVKNPLFQDDPTPVGSPTVTK